MRILAFDTSGPALSAAAAEGARILAHHHEPLAQGHAERLLPVLEEALAGAGWTWRTVEVIAVTTGPGNFTGLRVGIAVGRALALALGCPTLGLGTLEVMAEGARDEGDRRPILSLLDARRGECYVQRFTPDLTPLEPPRLVPRAELNLGSCRIAEGSPEARALAALAARRLAAGVAPVPGTELHPLYLRAPDARPGAGASLLAAG